METPAGSTRISMGILVAMVLAAAAGLVFVMRASTQEVPQAQRVPVLDTRPQPFSYAAFDRLCHTYVNDVGLVDYSGIIRSPADLDAFLAQVREISPRSNIATFTTRDEALAYWINAYNAWMIKAVTAAYPIESVNDIGKAPSVFDQKGRICGGEDYSLNQIEHEIVRRDFLEPRAHFALNCGSWGCPWLPNEAFVPERLDEQLDREARRFFADKSHLSLSVDSRTVQISPILDWYREDFLAWLQEDKGIAKPVILDFVKLYAPAELAAKFERSWQVAYLPYGWQLNDANAPWAGERGSPPVGAR